MGDDMGSSNELSATEAGDGLLYDGTATALPVAYGDETVTTTDYAGSREGRSGSLEHTAVHETGGNTGTGAREALAETGSARVAAAGSAVVAASSRGSNERDTPAADPGQAGGTMSVITRGGSTSGAATAAPATAISSPSKGGGSSHKVETTGRRPESEAPAPLPVLTQAVGSSAVAKQAAMNTTPPFEAKSHSGSSDDPAPGESGTRKPESRDTSAQPAKGTADKTAAADPGTGGRGSEPPDSGKPPTGGGSSEGGEGEEDGGDKEVAAPDQGPQTVAETIATRSARVEELIEVGNTKDRLAAELRAATLREQELQARVRELDGTLVEEMEGALARERRRFDDYVRPERRAVVARTLAIVRGVRPGWLDSPVAHTTVGWYLRLPKPEAQEDGPPLWQHYSVFATATAWPDGVRQADDWLRYRGQLANSWKACPDEILGVQAEGRGRDRQLPTAPLWQAMLDAKYAHVSNLDNIRELAVWRTKTERVTDPPSRGRSVRVFLDEHDATEYPHSLRLDNGSTSYFIGLFYNRERHTDFQDVANYDELLRHDTGRNTRRYDELEELNRTMRHAEPYEPTQWQRD
jgi:hypothetical protein